MLGLLLENDRKEIKKEYTFRFLNLMLGFLILASVIWGVSLVPSYLLLRVEEKRVVGQLNEVEKTDTQKNKTDIDKLSSALIEKIRTVDTKEYSVSEIIKLVDNSNLGQVAITAIYFSEDGSNKTSLRISGLANSRENLLVFSRRLEDQNMFEVVDLPFSNFAKDADISFSADITLKSL
jgi:hypothetical protein